MQYLNDILLTMFAVAFGLSVARVPGYWSVLTMLLAFGVAWSRVYLGVHWPLDMVGPFIVALGASPLVRIAKGTKPAQNLRHQALALYDRLLGIVHIPATVSPRSFVRNVRS